MKKKALNLLLLITIMGALIIYNVIYTLQFFNIHIKSGTATPYTMIVFVIVAIIPFFLANIVGKLIRMLFIEIWSFIRLQFYKTSNSIREPFKTKGDE